VSKFEELNEELDLTLTPDLTGNTDAHLFRLIDEEYETQKL
jgi:hypothetical protein